MPRMARLEMPGSLYHVMARGIDGMKIFGDDEDRKEFLKRFSGHMRACCYKCLAWCLMDNHYHFLLRSNENPLSKLMRPLNGGYARWFNNKYQRKGYLYQDRFKSVLCQDQEYSRSLIRYIHLNPLRARKVYSLEELKKYRWSGHAFLINKSGALGKEFHERNEALRQFGHTEKKAIKRYYSYLAESIDTDNLEKSGLLPDDDLVELSGSNKGWPAVIGDPEFAKAAMERHAVGIYRKHRKADYASEMEKLAGRICGEYSIKKGDLLSRGRKSCRSDARALFCYHAHVEELIPLSVIGRFLRITHISAARLSLRGEKLLKPEASAKRN